LNAQREHHIATRWARFIALAVLGLAACLLPLPAEEGFWTFQKPPDTEIKKFCGFDPDDAWFRHAKLASVHIEMQGAAGSGTFVSHDGLVATNHHVIVDFLPLLSRGEKNYVRDGFLAKTPAEELRCPGLKLLVQTEEVLFTPQMLDALSGARDPESVQQACRKVAAAESERRGQPCRVVSLYGGGEFWLYIYKAYDDVRLVFAPEEALANFGGDPDNFCFPRHQVDISFVRAYENGQPAQVEAYLQWSEKGPAEGDTVFALGNPGMSERDLPLSYLWYLRDVEWPLKIATMEAQREALKRYAAKSADAERQTYAALFGLENQLKLTVGLKTILSRPDIIKLLTDREAVRRKELRASANAARVLGDAFPDSEEAVKLLASGAASRHFSNFGRIRLFSATEAILHFAKLSADQPDRGPAIAQGLTKFLKEQVYPAGEYHPEIEAAEIYGFLTAADKMLSDDDPLRAILLKDQTADGAALRLGKTQLNTLNGCVQLLAQGAEGISESDDPALLLTRELAAFHEKQKGDEQSAENARAAVEASADRVRRALYIIQGSAMPPEANNTLRISFGKVLGYELDGQKVEWRTTFRSMIARAEAAGNKDPYTLSKMFVAAKDKLDLDTPLDFIHTSDGGPGVSGGAMLDREGHLIGVQFDGNQYGVASPYFAMPSAKGGRSIAVTSASVLVSLRQIYGAESLARELIDGKRAPEKK